MVLVRSAYVAHVIDHKSADLPPDHLATYSLFDCIIFGDWLSPILAAYSTQLSCPSSMNRAIDVSLYSITHGIPYTPQQ